MCEIQSFPVCLLTNEGPWYHPGTEITMYKRLFLFLPPNISIFVCYPSLFGNGEMAHERIQWELLSQLCWLQEQCCSADMSSCSTWFYLTDVCFTRGLWRKDLFSTYFGMAHMILTIYLLEPKKHWKFLEPEDSVLSITLILEIDYKSYTTKIFHLHINQWLKDLKALLLTMKLDLRGGMWAFCIPSGVMQAPR